MSEGFDAEAEPLQPTKVDVERQHQEPKPNFSVFARSVVQFSRGVRLAKEREEARKLDFNDKFCTFLIASCYITFVFCRNFMSPIAPTLKDDGWGYDNDKHGTLLVCAGVAYGVGKLINGQLSTMFDPR